MHVVMLHKLVLTGCSLNKQNSKVGKKFQFSFQQRQV